MKTIEIERKELLRIAENMKRYGGSFVESLGKALLQADEENQNRIKFAFPKIWEKYANMQKEIK